MLGSVFKMDAWCLSVMHVRLRLLTNHICSAWLGTSGTYPLFCLVECLCMLDIK